MIFSVGPEHHTFTILARSQETGAFGLGIATYSLASGGRICHVASGVGTVSVQAFPDPRLVPVAMSLLGQQIPPPLVLGALKSIDPHWEYRQIGIVGRTGVCACHTGKHARPWAGHVIGDGFLVMGNVLAGSQVLDEMASAFLDSREETLAERLLRAIEGGRDAGGQMPPYNERSAAISVFESEPYPIVDLRVDVHTDAVTELRKAYETYRPYIPLYYELRPKRPFDAPPQEEWISQQAGLTEDK